jgi:hypothetical protein
LTWNVNAVRVPLNEDCWLGINGAPAAYSGAAYQSAIKQWVKALNDEGITAILDLHWSAPGRIAATTQWPMADADHSITFWSSVAAAFARTPGVVFDTFNESAMGAEQPTVADWACWLSGCPTSYQSCRSGQCTTVSYQVAGQQELIDSIRRAGAKQPIMVGGLNWAGDPCGVKNGVAAGQCSWLAYEPSDPDHQLVLSFHSYNWTNCTTTACYDEDVLPVGAKVPVVIGEFGEVDCSARFDDQLMTWADQHDISYLAWSWERVATTSTTCISGHSPSSPGVGVNLQLLSSYDGTPNKIAPESAAIRQHFLSVQR